MMAHKLAESRLLSGFIYGDAHTGEYVYFPGSELDAAVPVAVYETMTGREDISLAEALSLIEHRSLRPVRHPVFGEKTI